MALRAYTPAEFRAIAGQLGTVYGQGEREILRLLADGNLTGWNEAFLTQRLAEVRTIVAGLDQAAVSWSGVHIPAIYEHKLALGAQMAGLSPVMTALHQEQVALIQRAVVTSMNYANGGIGRAVEDVYRRASLEALQAEMVGGGSGDDVAKRYLTNLRENGITSFTDRAGRSWNMETYAEMVAETNSREASWAATINQELEEGEDLVRISDHLDECPLCRPWEGKVVSITGLTEGYPTLEEARATGFGHPRCLHELLPYDGDEEPRAKIPAGKSGAGYKGVDTEAIADDYGGWSFDKAPDVRYEKLEEIRGIVPDGLASKNDNIVRINTDNLSARGQFARDWTLRHELTHMTNLDKGSSRLAEGINDARVVLHVLQHQRKSLEMEAISRFGAATPANMLRAMDAEIGIYGGLVRSLERSALSITYREGMSERQNIIAAGRWLRSVLKTETLDKIDSKIHAHLSSKLVDHVDELAQDGKVSNGFWRDIDDLRSVGASRSSLLSKAESYLRGANSPLVAITSKTSAVSEFKTLEVLTDGLF